MITSDDGIKRLEVREGLRLRAYLDVKGIPTIGVGHTSPGICLGLVWTPQQAEDALRKDLKRCEDCINLYCCTKLTQFQFDALVSFVFNVGCDAFMHSTMLRKLNQGDIDGAAKEFDRWHIPPAVTERRNTEKQQFLGQ